MNASLWKLRRHRPIMPVPPPGRLVSVGTHRLHIWCDGDGGPSVIFDAALGGSSLSWSLVHPSIARTTRACVYDRGGFGWSEAGPLPRTAGRIADELYALLRAAADYLREPENCLFVSRARRAFVCIAPCQ